MYTIEQCTVYACNTKYVIAAATAAIPSTATTATTNWCNNNLNHTINKHIEWKISKYFSFFFVRQFATWLYFLPLAFYLFFVYIFSLNPILLSISRAHFNVIYFSFFSSFYDSFLHNFLFFYFTAHSSRSEEYIWNKKKESFSHLRL